MVGRKCLDGASLGQAVAALIRKDEVDAAVSFEVIEQDETATVLVRRQGAKESVRQLELEGASCQRWTDAVALTIAVVIDASVLERMDIGPSAGESAEEPAPPSPSPAVRSATSLPVQSLPPPRSSQLPLPHDRPAPPPVQISAVCDDR